MIWAATFSYSTISFSFAIWLCYERPPSATPPCLQVHREGPHCTLQTWVLQKNTPSERETTQVCRHSPSNSSTRHDTVSLTLFVCIKMPPCSNLWHTHRKTHTRKNENVDIQRATCSSMPVWFVSLCVFTRHDRLKKPKSDESVKRARQTLLQRYGSMNRKVSLPVYNCSAMISSLISPASWAFPWSIISSWVLILRPFPSPGFMLSASNFEGSITNLYSLQAKIVTERPLKGPSRMQNLFRDRPNRKDRDKLKHPGEKKRRKVPIINSSG